MSHNTTEKSQELLFRINQSIQGVESNLEKTTQTRQEYREILLKLKSMKHRYFSLSSNPLEDTLYKEELEGELLEIPSFFRNEQFWATPPLLISHDPDSEMDSGQEVNTKSDIERALGITTDLGKECLKVALENIQLLDQKNKDYGSSNLDEFGSYGVLVRLSDKMGRLKNLISSKKKPNFESLIDTWKDAMNYALIGAVLHSRENKSDKS